MSTTPTPPSEAGEMAGQAEIAAGITLGSKPIRKRGRIVAQRATRKLPNGSLQSVIYPLYALAALDRKGAA